MEISPCKKYLRRRAPGFLAVCSLFFLSVAHSFANDGAATDANPDGALDRAEEGERAAQVALGVDFVKEATQLGLAPAAANDALSDAIRWYSLAARRGFPGATSLDQSGIRFFPIRAVRDARN